MARSPPLALDIDGTLTRAAGGIDPAIFPALRRWEAPIVLTTGKSFPYPIALCHYADIPERVVAENGGVVCIDDTLELRGPADRIAAVRRALGDDEIDLGWGDVDLVNRWRETELAVDRTVSRTRLATIAARFDLEVVDSNYAYHVKDPAVTKATGIERAAELLNLDLDEVVAIGDSENDVELFERVGYAVALANATEVAKCAADEVAPEGFAQGALAVLDRLADQS